MDPTTSTTPTNPTNRTSPVKFERTASQPIAIPGAKEKLEKGYSTEDTLWSWQQNPTVDIFTVGRFSPKPTPPRD